jgi:L-fuconolactonase
MKLIDTHIHVWDLGKAEYSWLKNNTSILNRTYEAKELEPERIRAGITTGVLIQAANNAEDTKYMLRTAEANDWITGVVGWLPLQDPSVTAGILAHQYGPDSYLKGVRHLIHDEPDAKWLLRDTVLESLGLLAGFDIPYDLVGTLPAHIETALKVAEQWPALRMVFDHFNQPPIGRKDREWENLMKTAARHPNFYVKLSGLGTAARKGQEWTAADLEPCIEFALHYFGEHRCFLGGDWPVSLLAGTYETTWTAYHTLIEKYLGQEGREKLYHENAERFYKL